MAVVYLKLKAICSEHLLCTADVIEIRQNLMTLGIVHALQVDVPIKFMINALHVTCTSGLIATSLFHKSVYSACRVAGSSNLVKLLKKCYLEFNGNSITLRFRFFFFFNIQTSPLYRGVYCHHQVVRNLVLKYVINNIISLRLGGLLKLHSSQFEKTYEIKLID